MKKLKLCFMWHMHQPNYQNALTGKMEFPWVLAHGLKNYFDMPFLAQKYNIKATFNLTPSLLKQLLTIKNDLANNSFEWDVGDDFFEKNKGNYLSQNLPSASTKEMIDFVDGIVDYYKKLFLENKIDLWTTPYYHPILPLLIDPKEAISPNPNALLPKIDGNFKEEAKEEVARAIKFFESIFERKPSGFWPAEGSVSHQAALLLMDCGVKNIAADEWLLEGKSKYKYYLLNNNDENANKIDNNEITDKNSCETDKQDEADKKELKIFFRDRDLSDSIGFRYSSLTAQEAVDDFFGKLEHIRKYHEDAVVSIVLDGENAWEFFEKNGKPFFEELYKRINTTQWIETEFLSKVEDNKTQESQATKDSNKLKKLKTGSWAGDFSIWIGDLEKNRLWEELFEVKKIIQENKKDKNYEQAYEIFLDALGSDWLWWVGKSENKETKEGYKNLFKSKLLKIYELLKVSTPLSLLLLGEGSFVSKYLNDSSKTVTFGEFLGDGFDILDLKYESSVMPLDKLYANYLAYKQKNLEMEFVLAGRDLGKIDKIEVIVDGVSKFYLIKDSLFFGFLKLPAQEGKIFRVKLYENEKLMQTIPTYKPLEIKI